jgi:hypothetical protein
MDHHRHLIATLPKADQLDEWNLNDESSGQSSSGSPIKTPFVRGLVDLGIQEWKLAYEITATQGEPRVDIRYVTLQENGVSYAPTAQATPDLGLTLKQFRMDEAPAPFPKFQSGDLYVAENRDGQRFAFYNDRGNLSQGQISNVVMSIPEGSGRSRIVGSGNPATELSPAKQKIFRLSHRQEMVR